VAYSGRVPGPVIELGRRAVRTYGRLTARLRPGPDFLIIGAKRSGSTSLYYTLLQHPGILPLFPSARLILKTVNTKGIHYFDTNYHSGQVWYRSHFPTTFKWKHAERNFGGRVVVGEASPYYLFPPLPLPVQRQRSRMCGYHSSFAIPSIAPFHTIESAAARAPRRFRRLRKHMPRRLAGLAR
jgi:hypothetical protein